MLCEKCQYTVGLTAVKRRDFLWRLKKKKRKKKKNGAPVSLFLSRDEEEIFTKTIGRAGGGRGGREEERH